MPKKVAPFGRGRIEGFTLSGGRRALLHTPRRSLEEARKDLRLGRFDRLVETSRGVWELAHLSAADPDCSWCAGDNRQRMRCVCCWPVCPRCKGNMDECGCRFG